LAPGVSGTVHSAVPVVFLNGTADFVDPPGNVAGATATMPNALLVSVPGSGYWILANATSSSCLLAATTAFIQAGRPASPGALDCLHPSHALTDAVLRLSGPAGLGNAATPKNPSRRTGARVRSARG
jgi:hypothetical protein